VQNCVNLMLGNIGARRASRDAKGRRRAAAAIPQGEERVIVATGRYLGGFDDSRLHALFLTMPIAWKGTLAQYGRPVASSQQRQARGEARRLKVLTDENAKLKKLLAEAMLDNAMLKDLNSKKW
jgi:hypothetical protein